MFLSGRDLLRGLCLADGREVAPVLRGHGDHAHHSLDAPAGVAARERGGLTHLFRPLIKISSGFAE